MEPDRGETNTPERADVAPKHPLKFQTYGVPRTVFDRACCEIIPSRSHAAMVALFLNRVPYDTIKKWRQGKRSAPQWARAILIERARQEESRWFTLAAKVKAMPAGRGSAWRSKKNPAD